MNQIQKYEYLLEPVEEVRTDRNIYQAHLVLDFKEEVNETVLIVVIF